MSRAISRGSLLLFVVAVAFGSATCSKSSSSKPKTTPPPPIVPELYFIVPPEGPDTGGNTVTLFTRNFTDDFLTDLPDVYFGSIQVDPANVIMATPAEVRAIAPAGMLGSVVDITLTATVTPETATCVGCYTYVAPVSCMVINTAPAVGDVAGGETVTVFGTGFEPLSEVDFGTEA